MLSLLMFYRRLRMNNKIKTLRLATGMTQNTLSSLSGVNIRQIQKYESGDYDVDKMALKNAVAIARILRCHAEDLMGEKEGE